MSTTDPKSTEDSSKKKSWLEEAWEWLTLNAASLLVWLRSTEGIVCAGVIALNFLFSWPINEFLIEYVSKPLLSKVFRNSVNDWVVALLFILLVAITLKSWFESKTPSNSSALLSLILFIDLLYYRFYNTEIWEFTPSLVYPKITYIDALIAYLGFYLLWSVVAVIRFFASQPKKREGRIPYFSSLPLLSNEHDELGYKTYAQKLSDYLLNINTSETVVVGVNGAWGSGKTSFLNFVKQGLRKDTNIILMEFKPWLNYSSGSLSSHFFSEISSTLKPYSNKLSLNISRYAVILNEIGESSLPKLLTAVSGILEKDKTTTDLFDEINEEIARINKRLVITIDDWDRLDEDEIFTLIKLIRNTASFRNVIYLIAYDKSYILNALGKLSIYNPEEFFNKIAQIETNLPLFEKEKLIDHLIRGLNTINKKANDKGIEEFIQIANQNGLIKEFIFENILNVRDIVNLLNMISLDFTESIRSEVFFSDFLLLEIIKVKHIKIHALLASRRSTFFDVKDNVLKLKINAKNGTTIFEEKIKEEYAESKKSIIKIVHTLFHPPIVPYAVSIHRGYRNTTTGLYNSYLSINKRDSFDKYFAYELFDRHISQRELIGLMKDGKPDECFQYLLAKMNFSAQSELEEVCSQVLFIAKSSQIVTVFESSLMLFSKLIDEVAYKQNKWLTNELNSTFWETFIWRSKFQTIYSSVRDYHDFIISLIGGCKYPNSVFGLNIAENVFVLHLDDNTFEFQNSAFSLKEFKDIFFENFKSFCERKDVNLYYEHLSNPLKYNIWKFLQTLTVITEEGIANIEERYWEVLRDVILYDPDRFILSSFKLENITTEVTFGPSVTQAYFIIREELAVLISDRDRLINIIEDAPKGSLYKDDFLTLLRSNTTGRATEAINEALRNPTD